jgi:16S rRNA (cytosine967-C5)-methyltransferase
MPQKKPRSPQRPPRPDDARGIALTLLRKWETSGAYIDDLLATVEGLDPRDRRLLQDLVYGVIRQRRRLDHILDSFCSQGIDSLPTEVRCLLRLGAYQLLHSDRIPTYAAVDEAVRLAKEAGFSGLAGVVNAVLRRAAESADSVPFPDREEHPIEFLGLHYSFPDWLVQWLIERFGEENAEILMRFANEPPPLWVRLNRLETNPEEVIASLERQGIRVARDPVIPTCLRLEAVGALPALPGFREGYFQVQDRSAQLVSPVVDPQPGEVIIDACSAPGGKATHLAELMGDRGTVIAVDRDPRRLVRVRENAERLGLSCITTRAGDVTEDLPFLPEKIDRILVDAPCSGLGTLGRRPDLRWRLEPDAPARMAENQLTILTTLARRLKPGGVLVYSTCTLTPEENRGVVKAFLNRNPSFSLDSAAPYLPRDFECVVDSEGFVETLPFRDEMDGTFIARLTRDR